ncbi:MAG: metal-dependent hydrolase [Burkholderiales bacterium]|nr:metal-dependent hydrolase [Burkholderiales bacterium]
MDPVSHALLGAACGRSVARSHGRAAMLAGVAGALLPDADVLIHAAGDPLFTIEYHRHFSHSFAVAPLGALIAAGAVWLALKRRAGLGVLYFAALAGFLSAILLDACTSYGTHLLWPFDDTRFAWRVIAVVDPVMTLILLAGVVLAFRIDSAAWARAAVALAVVYLGCGWIQRERASEAVEQLAASRGHAVVRPEVKPTLGNLLLWRSVYPAGSDYVADAVRVGPFSRPIVYPGRTVPRVVPEDLSPPLPAGSVQALDVARFARLSEGYLARHPDHPDVIGDVRYAMLPDDVRPIWGIRIDPHRADYHVELLTFREFTAQDRRRFLAMLRGAAVPERQDLRK